MKPPAPPRVDDHYRYWQFAPPEPSPRLLWWCERVRSGWSRNRRIGSQGYDTSAQYFGVYIWEYINVLQPLLWEMEGIE